jgi:hypothetical protein
MKAQVEPASTSKMAPSQACWPEALVPFWLMSLCLSAPWHMSISMILIVFMAQQLISLRAKGQDE